MLVCDTATAVSQERTPEGFLRVRARIGRTGIQLYRAGEIGAPPGVPPDRMLRVYRPPEDVFEPASLASFASKPVTLDHPPRMVDSANWKLFAVGHSGLGVARDGDHVSADLTITDAAAVARAQAGAELSNGYWADFVFEPGQTPEGEAYDALQRRIRGNHIALVDTGRCGPSCRIDADPAAQTDSAARADCACPVNDALDTMSVDGTTLRTDAAGAAVITRLRQAIEARDGEIAALKAAGAALKAAGAALKTAAPGDPVLQGSSEQLVVSANGGSGVFRGIAIRDVGLPPGDNDQYPPTATVGLMTKGVVWVNAAVAVSPGQPVYATPAGLLTNVSTGNTPVSNALWESATAGAALAKLRLN